VGEAALAAAWCVVGARPSAPGGGAPAVVDSTVPWIVAPAAASSLGALGELPHATVMPSAPATRKAPTTILKIFIARSLGSFNALSSASARRRGPPALHRPGCKS